MNIEEIVKNLVGPVDATGEHGVDEKRLENLNEMIRLTYDLLDEIKMAAGARFNYQASMKAIGERAAEALDQFGISGYN